MRNLVASNVLYIGIPIILCGVLRATGIGVFPSAIISILAILAIAIGQWIWRYNGLGSKNSNDDSTNEKSTQEE